MSNPLTPYDTGEVLEPKPWIKDTPAELLDPKKNPYHDELRSRYGYVDFDDEEGHTLATVDTRRVGDSYFMQVTDHVSGRMRAFLIGYDEEEDQP